MNKSDPSQISGNNSFYLNPENVPYSASKEPSVVVIEKEETFYNLCTVEASCGGRVKYGRFKDRNHALVCTLFGCMTFFLLLAVIAPLIIYAIVDMGINEQVAIDGPNNPNYKSWQNNVVSPGADDLKVTYTVNLFDLQNPLEVISGGKPKLVERGPYVYNEYFQKFDIVWSDDGNIVTYNNYKYYVYNQAMSGPGTSEFDNITLPYATVLGFEYLLNSLPESVQAMYTAGVLSGLQAAEIKVLHQITEVYDQVQASNKIILRNKKDQILQQLRNTNVSMQLYFADLYYYFNQTSAGQVVFKNLMCQTPNGISPFKQLHPSEAWFGWLNDPLLAQVTPLLAKVKALTNQTIAWSTAVPGAAINYTSFADTRRRRSPDTFYTGKKNKNQIAAYIRYQNMSLMHTCIEPTKSQNMSDYIEGEEFPACAHFHNDWNESKAEEHGYTLPFASDYANRIQGSDANQYARPLSTNKYQVFISDIYRSAFLEFQETNSWFGIKTKRFGLQSKDMLNATQDPENAQYYAFGPQGLLNATKASNVPVFISFPHFYLADPNLVAAVEGLNPQKEIHQTYLDVEPQTGLLVEARKRLQVNYLMQDYTIPEVAESTVDLGYAACANMTILTAELGSFGIDVPDIQCNTSIVTSAIECLAQPSTWKFQSGQIFVPYGWVSEDLSLPESDANALQNTLFIMDDIAAGVRLWSLFAGGFFFAMLCATLLYQYCYRRQQQYSKLDWYKYNHNKHSGLLGSSASAPPQMDGFGVSVGDRLNTAQPLLSSEDDEEVGGEHINAINNTHNLNRTSINRR
jgi:hypothetical protein